jgi:hypothetical protein
MPGGAIIHVELGPRPEQAGGTKVQDDDEGTDA